MNSAKHLAILGMASLVAVGASGCRTCCLPSRAATTPPLEATVAGETYYEVRANGREHWAETLRVDKSWVVLDAYPRHPRVDNAAAMRQAGRLKIWIPRDRLESIVLESWPGNPSGLNLP